MSRWMCVWWLVGCSGEIEDPSSPSFDPESWLRELALANHALLGPLREASDYSRSGLTGSLEDGEQIEFWVGKIAPPGFASVSGDAVFFRSDETFQFVTWTLDLQYDGLDVDQTTVTGIATLLLEENLFEGVLQSHTFEGTLTFRESANDVDYEAGLAGSTLNDVEGSVGEANVSWTNPEPDLP